MRRRHDPSSTPDDDLTVPAARSARRAATPWVTVAAGAGAVTLVVAVAGMVGAATGVGESLVVEGSTADGGSGVEDGVPVVTPRPDVPRPEVTRIPPPESPTDDGGDTGDDPAPAPRPSAGGTDGPTTAPPASAEPGREPSTPPPTSPAPTPAPTPSEPEPTPEPGQRSVTWVQERLRVHGATLEVTGTMDDATVTALRAFQQAHGLPGDGAVTAATAEALATAPGSGGEESTDPGGTTPTEPAPTPSTDRPSAAVPGPTPSSDEPTETATAPPS